MYEQLSLFDSEQKKDKPKKETLFEQILPVIKNPLFLVQIVFAGIAPIMSRNYTIR